MGWREEKHKSCQRNTGVSLNSDVSILISNNYFLLHLCFETMHECIFSTKFDYVYSLFTANTCFTWQDLLYFARMPRKMQRIWRCINRNHEMSKTMGKRSTLKKFHVLGGNVKSISIFPAPPYYWTPPS